MSPPLPIAVVAADFRTASTAWRARLELSAAERQALFAELKPQGVTGFVQLATCNRTEWIAMGERPEWVAQLLHAEALARWGTTEDAPVTPEVYAGDAAAAHVLRVAIGLESFARGERQIAHQLHGAFDSARAEGTACGRLNLLGTAVGRTVARASSLTGFRTGKAGVHGEVVAWLTEALPHTRRTVAVVGMGHIGTMLANRLRNEGWTVLRANRTVPDDSDWLPLASIKGGQAPNVDALCLCTGAQDPIWTLDDVPESWRDAYVVDIGSPIQADLALADHPQVTLVNLDTLLHHPARTATHEAVHAAADVVDVGLDELRRAIGKRKFRRIVHSSRENYATIAWQSLPACLEKHGIAAGSPGRTALEADLRALLRDHAHAVLEAVENLSTPETS